MKTKITDILEEKANEFLIEGTKFKSGRMREKDRDMARSNFSFSYAINVYLGRWEFADLNHRLLMSTGLTEYGAEVYEKRALLSVKRFL